MRRKAVCPGSSRKGRGGWERSLRAKVGSFEPGLYTDQGRAEENWGGTRVGGRGDGGDGEEVEGEGRRLGCSSLQWVPCLRTSEAMPRLGTWPGRRQGPWVLSMLREPPGTFSWLCTPILRSPGACSLAARTHGRFRRLPLVSPCFFSGGSGRSVQPRVSVARDRS